MKNLALAVASLVTVLVGLVACSGQTTEAARPPVSAAPSADPVRFVDGLERYQSNRASDWVAHADYVAVIRIVAERQASQRTHDPIFDGGAEPIARLVEARLDRVIWSAADRAVAGLPSEFLMAAAGWFDDDKPGLTRTAWKGGSRLEVGHTYVVALTEADNSCDVDGNVTLGDWNYFGTGGAIPFDDGVLGAGEFQGSEVEAADFKQSDSDPDSLRRAVDGKTMSELAALLRTAEPTRYTAEQLRRTAYPCGSE